VAASRNKEAKTAARQPQKEAEVPGDREQHMQRLEMVQLRIEAMIEASRKWHIDDMSLLFERARGGGRHNEGETARTDLAVDRDGGGGEGKWGRGGQAGQGREER
jgi:hypothetical protein